MTLMLLPAVCFPAFSKDADHAFTEVASLFWETPAAKIKIDKIRALRLRERTGPQPVSDGGFRKGHPGHSSL